MIILYFSAALEKARPEDWPIRAFAFGWDAANRSLSMTVVDDNRHCVHVRISGGLRFAHVTSSAAFYSLGRHVIIEYCRERSISE